jgi:uncharacterized RDD family membrane protein YckC
MPPPAPEPYPAAPPISEPYGGGGPPGVTGELAGRWPRLFAAIIDSFIVGVIGWLIAAPIVGGSAITDTKHLGARFTANGISAVIAIVYFGLQHGKWGQSIGKRALRIRVVRVADAGPIGYGASFGRVAFTYVFSIITFNVGALIDVIFILWDPRKQAVHDKVVKTVVVNADGPDPYAGV